MTGAPNHADREHAQWSASSTSRNCTCAGAIAMATLAGEEVESIHAAWGTSAHEISERCLKNGGDALQFLGTEVKTKQHAIPVDEEMCATAQEYVGYCRKTVAENPGSQIFIEQHFSLAALDPPLQAGGTGDAVIYKPSIKELEIIDLKGGRGAVEVEGNPQGRSYGVGALLLFPDFDVEKVRVTIVQPRCAVRGATIRSEVFHVSVLIDWTDNLLQSMKRARDALDEFEQIGGSRVLFDEWAEKWLQPGACKFCRAEGICPKLRNKALAIAPEAIQAWFEDPTLVTKPDVKANMPELLSPEERGHILDGLEMLEDFIKAVRASEHTRAERGDPAAGWQLSDKIGNRAWVETDEAKLADLFRDKFGMPPDEMFVAKIKSPAQIEKLIGAKRKAEVDALCHKPVKGTNLVSSAKTTRPPAKSKVETFAEEVKD